jgi:predicted ferric reductase
MGYLPSRPLSFLISIYVGINLIFSLLPVNNPWQTIGLATPRNWIASYFSNRVGVLSFANIVLAVLFAARNNPLMYLAGFTQTSNITFHRWSARIATIQAVIHSILFTITYFWSGGYSAYSAEAAKAYYWWGIIATLALALAICLATLPLRIWKYETFLIVHIGLAIVALVACWYHIIERYSKDWGYEVYLYISFTFWGYDRLARLVRLGVYNRAGLSSRAYAELLPGTDFIKLTVFPKMGWEFQPGQHSFLYFPSIGKPYESHPFSIVSWSCGSQARSPSGNQSQSPFGKTDIVPTSNPDTSAQNNPHSSNRTQLTPSITFLIRPSSGATFQLYNYVHSVSSSSQSSQAGGPVPVDALIEGPYGQAHPVHKSNLIVCIAGGVGITAILGYVSAFVEAQRMAGEETAQGSMAERMVVAWSAKELGLIDAVRGMIPIDAEARGLELMFACTGRGPREDENRRIDIGQVIQAETQGLRKRKLAVVSCGPGGMADVVRMEVVKSLRQGYNVELFEEAFAW